MLTSAAGKAAASTVTVFGSVPLTAPAKVKTAIEVGIHGTFLPQNGALREEAAA